MKSRTDAPRSEPRNSTRQETTVRDMSRTSGASRSEAPPTAAVDDTLLTTDEVASLLRVHRRTVQRLVERGELAAVHIGSAVRFDPRDLGGLIADHRRRRATGGVLPSSRPPAVRGARISFAERLRSDRNEHRTAHA